MNVLPPPAPLSLSGNIAENFKRFSQAFNIYLIATGLSEKSKKVRANVLLHVIGEEGVRVFNGMTWAVEDHKEDPERIIGKLKDYCTPRTNITFERNVFNRRSQNIQETFDEFYTDLCRLSQSCDYGALADDMIRDRIVVGVRVKELRTKLMRVGDLTLVKAIDVCRIWEATDAQTNSLANGLMPPASVNHVSRGRGRSRGQNRGRGRGRHTGGRDTEHRREPEHHPPGGAASSRRHQY